MVAEFPKIDYKLSKKLNKGCKYYKGKPVYNKDLWPLCECLDCGTKNYVEPHGVGTVCSKCKMETEHIPIKGVEYH